MAAKSLASLPIEVTEHILSLLWLSPLLRPQRATLIKSSLLVSRTWQSVFVRIAATDVYVLSPSHGIAFLDMLRARSLTKVNYPFDTLCRSITIQHENDHLLPGPDYQEEQPMGFIFRDIIAELYRLSGRLSMLRRISLELQDYLMETVFERNHTLFSHFPRQVTELELKFSYGIETDPLAVSAIKSRGYEKFGLEKVKSTGLNVKRLMVLGTSSGVAKEVLDVFGGLDKVEVFKQDAWKEEVKQVVKSEAAAPREEEDEEDEDEEFFDFDSETDMESVSNTIEHDKDTQWEEYEKFLAGSFSKDELTRMLFAMQRQIAVA
ncbi:hypothetical protein PM082_011796 [Marasmius tenuissimus]|nr:hypothetical protein PM082_011796 [Marasmius tenuissimus]